VADGGTGKTCTRSARSRRNFHVPEDHARLGDPARASRAAPTTAMQLEVVPTPEIDVRRSARPRDGGGRELQRRLGRPRRADLAVRRAQAALPRRGLRCVGHRLGRRPQAREALEAGDEVVIHCNQDDGDDEECNGGDPMFSPTQRIWGYETPDGSFAQFCRVQARQLMPRPKHLTWEESACYTLTLATAYRMLFGHRPHIVLRPGQNVLVWGASGGLGSFAVQLMRRGRRQRDRRDLVR
jgi:crotonyl-CoA carboxylase/reductase